MDFWVLDASGQEVGMIPWHWYADNKEERNLRGYWGFRVCTVRNEDLQ